MSLLTEPAKVEVAAEMAPFAVNPAHMLLDELEARDTEYSEFAEAFEGAPTTREGLLSGEFVITPDVADRLEAYFGVKAYIWLHFEEEFRKAIAAGKSPIDPWPLPVWNKANGKIHLRVPVSLHRRLVREAKSEGVSLNQLLLAYISEGIARSDSFLACNGAGPAQVEEPKKRQKLAS